MSLVGNWDFLSISGADQSGNGNSASYQNGASVDGSGSVVLDGVDDYIEIADAPQYALTEGTIHATFVAAGGSLDGARSTDVTDTSMQALESRDSSGYDNGGHVSIHLDGDGLIYVHHQSDEDD